MFFDPKQPDGPPTPTPEFRAFIEKHARTMPTQATPCDNARLREALTRIVGLYDTQYLRPHADGGRVKHAIDQARKFLA